MRESPLVCVLVVLVPLPVVTVSPRVTALEKELPEVKLFEVPVLKPVVEPVLKPTCWIGELLNVLLLLNDVEVEFVLLMLDP